MRVNVAKKFDYLRDDSRPSCLVAGSNSRPVVSMEVFVKQDAVMPVRISLKLAGTAKHGPVSVGVIQEGAKTSRRESSLATSNKFICTPEPVGHSIVKVFP